MEGNPGISHYNNLMILILAYPSHDPKTTFYPYLYLPVDIQG